MIDTTFVIPLVTTLAGAAALAVLALAVNGVVDRRHRRRFEAAASGNCGRCFNHGVADIVSGFSATCTRCLGVSATAAGRAHLATLLAQLPGTDIAAAVRAPFDVLVSLGADRARTAPA